ncbi:hypothetical protein ACU10_02690 [Xanthomonas oryzae pv. oryzicola]|nr:hypothetical protein ACU13_02690 [Xanthomonas oryzae pv. oryzicola]AKN95864.1 hypothetical protein ACU10_02690 [Xanthomonas oryzae pv. oryzicola]AKO11087.1 hypothetical protein ACU14_02675 [Xanthomonas oryzae pv. oryzicola]AKO14821.1 hypothetical protein ACU12_02680 [Xanthomonas oryzae pv. oryzicola]
MELTTASVHTDEVMEGIMWARLNRMRMRLQEALKGRGGEKFLEAIYQLYISMPPDRQARLLLSSEFCECYLAIEATQRKISTGSSEQQDAWELARNFALLHDLVCREHAIDELSKGRVSKYLAESRQWQLYSPLGDTYAKRSGEGSWSLEKVQNVGECIAVDFDSPVATNYEPRSGVLSQAYLPLDDFERQAVRAKIAESLRLIDEAEPLYGLIIRNFVRRIVVRKSQERSDQGPKHYGSEHVPRQPGSLRLLNIHRDELSVEACMESLMHESTHNFLAAWELAHGFFVANDYRHRVVSPWSGNQIPNSSFIHAVFVYYICHRLLRSHLANAKDLSESAVEHVHKRLAVCASGFLIQQPLSQRLMSTAPLNEDIGSMVDLMQLDMQRQYGYEAAV